MSIPVWVFKYHRYLVPVLGNGVLNKNYKKSVPGYLNISHSEHKVEFPVATGNERLLAELDGGAHVALVGKPGKEQPGEHRAECEPHQGVEDKGDHGLRAVHVDHPYAVPDGLLRLHANHAFQKYQVPVYRMVDQEPALNFQFGSHNEGTSVSLPIISTSNEAKM